MAKNTEQKDLTYLVVSLDDARNLLVAQIEKGKNVPNASVNENDDARRWYDYTDELLRRLFSSSKLSDEFTGRGGFVYDDDISTGHFLKRLESIYERLELFAPKGTPKVPTTNSVSKVERLARNFHKAARQIRSRHDNRPTLDVSDEYDVQDLLHALLVIHFEDVRAEEWTPSYAGGSSRMDFLLKSEKIVIETKKTRAGLGNREVADELAVDIIRYRSHSDCKILVCFVYDPEERINNPVGLMRDLSQRIDDIEVVVIVA